jgi:BMFP domain-containing protein YqiC
MNSGAMRVDECRRRHPPQWHLHQLCKFRYIVINQMVVEILMPGVHYGGAFEYGPAPVRSLRLHFLRQKLFSLLVFCFGLRYQLTMANESLDKLARALADSVPEGIRSVREDLHKNFKSVLQSGIGRLDLVTREEFEVQEAVLARTREKLQVLESRLKELETRKPARKKAARKKS